QSDILQGTRSPGAGLLPQGRGRWQRKAAGRGPPPTSIPSPLEGEEVRGEGGMPGSRTAAGSAPPSKFQPPPPHQPDPRHAEQERETDVPHGKRGGRERDEPLALVPGNVAGAQRELRTRKEQDDAEDRRREKSEHRAHRVAEE